MQANTHTQKIKINKSRTRTTRRKKENKKINKKNKRTRTREEEEGEEEEEDKEKEEEEEEEEIGDQKSRAKEEAHRKEDTMSGGAGGVASVRQPSLEAIFRLLIGLHQGAQSPQAPMLP